VSAAPAAVQPDGRPQNVIAESALNMSFCVATQRRTISNHSRGGLDQVRLGQPPPGRAQPPLVRCDGLLMPLDTLQRSRRERFAEQPRHLTARRRIVRTRELALAAVLCSSMFLFLAEAARSVSPDGRRRRAPRLPLARWCRYSYYSGMQTSKLTTGSARWSEPSARSPGGSWAGRAPQTLFRTGSGSTCPTRTS
jgi:hypothetical protein